MAKHRQTPYSRLLERLHREGGLPAIKADEAEEQGRLEEHLRKILHDDIFRSPNDTLFEHGAARRRWLTWAKLEFPIGSLVAVRDDGGNRESDHRPIYLSKRVLGEAPTTWNVATSPAAQMVDTDEPLDMQGEVTGYTLGGISDLPMVDVWFTKGWQWYTDDGDQFYDDEITVLRRGPATKTKRHR